MTTSQFWTHENHAVEIYSDKFFFQKSEYIHQNPVRAGIVAKAEDYLYSSASNFMDKGGLIDVEYYGTRPNDGILMAWGTIEDEPQDKYDIVLANINRNILLQQIPAYTTFMAEGASLIISGFYEADIADIQ
eukprot:gene36031-46820_t